ncbi:hypothetical protein VIGAN_10004500, partial [Vigna angularis var. angularis]
SQLFLTIAQSKKNKIKILIFMGTRRICPNMNQTCVCIFYCAHDSRFAHVSYTVFPLFIHSFLLLTKNGEKTNFFSSKSFCSIASNFIK